VTAVNVPENIGWAEWDERLRERGLVVGGSLGPLAGKVFRLGHMGTQADRALVDRAMDAIADALAKRKR
jgi:aspartate aminotransferase-like enzyme